MIIKTLFIVRSVLRIFSQSSVLANQNHIEYLSSSFLSKYPEPMDLSEQEWTDFFALMEKVRDVGGVSNMKNIFENLEAMGFFNEDSELLTPPAPPAGGEGE